MQDNPGRKEVGYLEELGPLLLVIRERYNVPSFGHRFER